MIPKEYLRPGQCEKNVLNFTRSTGGKKRGDLSVDEMTNNVKKLIREAYGLPTGSDETRKGGVELTGKNVT